MPNRWGDIEINSLMAEAQYEWLLKKVGEEKIREALLAMPPSRKGFPINVAIFLRIFLPKQEELLPDCEEDAMTLPPRKTYPVRVSTIAMLRRFREWFAADGRRAELRKNRNTKNGGPYYVVDQDTGESITPLYTREELEAFAKRVGIMKEYEVFDDTRPGSATSTETEKSAS